MAPTSSDTGTTPVSDPVWQLPHGAANYFPTDDGSRLVSEENWLAWAVMFERASSVCGFWEVVKGTEKCPELGHPGYENWKRKDASALAFITKCIKPDLIVKTMSVTSAHACWTSFETEFSQTGSGSVMLWFRRLTKPFAAGEDVAEHVKSFQQAIRYLATASFDIPGPIAAAILLSTLPSDPNDPGSWNNFISGIKIDQKTTTLAAVVNAILEEKRRLTESDSIESHKADTALATRVRTARANGKLFCTNCKRDGHEVKTCWAAGGPREGQVPAKFKKKFKGKEKARVAQDSGGDEGNSSVG